MENPGFLLLKKEYAAELMKEKPEIPVEELAKKVKEKWEQLTDPVKEELNIRAKKQGICNFDEQNKTVYNLARPAPTPRWG